MEARGTRARAAGRKRLSARYWRLRFANDVATRLVEYIDEQRYDYDYDDREYDRWYREPDPLEDSLDAVIPQLRARIQAGWSFNPLPLPGPSRRRDRAWRLAPSQGPIEQRLVDHLERLSSGPDPAWLLGDEPEDDLARLDAIAEAHFEGRLDSLLGLVLVRRFWIRPLAGWVAPSRGSARQVILSLVEHLLVEFPAPLWLFSAEPPSAATLRWLMWLITLGQGGSLRRLIELARIRWPQTWRPVANKLISALAEVPLDTHSPARGIMFAEILRLGGSTLELRWFEEVDFVIDPSAGELDDAELEFWRQSVAWLVRQREHLDNEIAPMILVWARHMQTERVRRGGRFEWRGRTYASVHDDACMYRQIVMMSESRRRLSWSVKGWDWQGRFGEHDWTIRELRTSEALQAESLAMSHCVRMYDVGCWRGHSAIFSVMRGERRCVTVEIHLPSRRVAQAKRACNQTPSPLELAVIEHWRATVVDPR